MIISHDHKYIFVHTPKTGGTSVMDVLEGTYCPGGKTRRLSRFRAFVSGIPQCHVKRWCRHLEVQYQKRLVGEDIWDKYFTFTFVRNPWALYVSLYFYMLNDSSRRKHPKRFEKVSSYNSFSDFVMDWARSDRFYPMIYDDEGNQLIDFIGKLENIESDLLYISEKCGLTLSDIPCLNVTEHSDYREYYTNEAREWVKKINRHSIERFGYEF